MSDRTIKRTPVRHERHQWMCDTDGCDGEMKWTRMTLTSHPPQYPHACTKCGRHENVMSRYYPNVYPVIEPRPDCGGDDE